MRGSDRPSGLVMVIHSQECGGYGGTYLIHGQECGGYGGTYLIHGQDCGGYGGTYLIHGQECGGYGGTYLIHGHAGAPEETRPDSLISCRRRNYDIRTGNV